MLHVVFLHRCRNVPIIGGRRHLRLGEHVGSGGMPSQKIFRIRCSNIASETIFGLKLATALTRTSIVHTTLDNLGLRYQPHSWGFHSFFFILVHLANICHSLNLD